MSILSVFSLYYVVGMNGYFFKVISMQQLQSLLGGGVVSSNEGATYQNPPQQLLQIHPQLLQVIRYGISLSLSLYLYKVSSIRSWFLSTLYIREYTGLKQVLQFTQIFMSPSNL